MPTLTRRRYPERPDCWHVYYGDVRAGTIARRVGNPFDTDPWEWNCGFYPGSHPRKHTSDTAATFEQARADFERAWAACDLGMSASHSKSGHRLRRMGCPLRANSGRPAHWTMTSASRLKLPGISVFGVR